MADDDGSRKEKKKKSKTVDGDKEFRKARKQVEQAMEQVRIAEKEAKHTQLPSDGRIQDGGIVFHNSMTIVHGNYINIEPAQNVQVGKHNTMVKNKRRKKKKSRSSSSEDDDDADGGATADREEIQEVKRLPIFTSRRLVTDTDIDTICVKVSNWRRFLRFLNLDDVYIENIHAEYFHHGSVKEFLLQGIKIWQRKEARGATIDLVAKALLKMECFDALRELQAQAL